MEEDIKQLEELILDRKSFLTGEKEHDEIYLKDIQAIENVLSRLKQLEEENTEWRGKYLIELAKVSDLEEKFLGEEKGR